MPNSQDIIASVIIPVFNKEDFIETCIETLDKQTLCHSKFEAIFINDGSSDRSREAIETAAKTHQWIKLINQPNKGVQEARNAGIKQARGSYLFFLDPDDTLSPNTLERVSSFFDLHRDETDLVTYPIAPFKNGKRLTPHPRYKVLNRTGIYDLTKPESQFICQTTMNICTKNLGSKNQLFDFEAPNGMVFHEDEFYIAKILRKKMVLGFYKDAEYQWIENEQSVSSSLLKPLYIYDNTVNAYEKLFESFNDTVPSYFQGMFVNDLGWKMRSNCALPTHLEGEKRKNAMDRLMGLVSRIDNDVLLNSPNMHLYHALFFINLKEGSDIAPYLGPGGIALLDNENVLYASKTIELLLLKTSLNKDCVRISGFAKSPLFSFVEKKAITLQAIYESEERKTVTSLELKHSSWNAIASKTETATFFDFDYEVEITPNSSILFIAEVNNNRIPVFITSSSPFSNFSKERKYEVERSGVFFKLHNRKAEISISFNPLSEEGISDSRKVKAYRKLIGQISKRSSHRNREIWLYCDSAGRIDNAWLQFKHDIKINDNVDRFYIANQISDLPDNGVSRLNIVRFGSKQHMLLHYSADKVFASDIEASCWRPRKDKTDTRYRDLFHAQLIYLQHGVLWAHMPWYYHKDRMRFDKEVISTTLERDSLINSYGFQPEDLIEAGMPRYAKLTAGGAPKNKILLCPSWRNYLIGSLKNGEREPNDSKFRKSDYYRRLKDFLDSEELHDLLHDSNYTLDLKLHPNFDCYKKHFCFENQLVNIVDSADISDYSIGITDYSSFSFDFLYLNRPVIYFVPDYELFKGGINHYNKLALPLDDAFGELAIEPSEAIDCLRRVVENGAKPLERYKERINELFIHKDSSACDRIYSAIKHE